MRLKQTEFSKKQRDAKRKKRVNAYVERESALPPLLRCMTDPLRQYELIPNGNPKFLTRSSQDKILRVLLTSCRV